MRITRLARRTREDHDKSYPTTGVRKGWDEVGRRGGGKVSDRRDIGNNGGRKI